MWLPQVILRVAIELQGVGPAVLLGGLADVLLVLWREGAIAAVVLVVALAIEMIDEVVLQCYLYAARHVVVHLRYAQRHADGFGTAIHWALLRLYQWVHKVYGTYYERMLRGILASHPVQTALAERALVRTTYRIAAFSFLTKQLFQGLCGVIFLCHHQLYVYFSSAKVIIFCEFTKFLQQKVMKSYLTIHIIA